MRRGVLSGLAMVLVVVGAVAAQAKQVIPTHSADVRQGITGAFHAVQVSVDNGSIAVEAGSAPRVRAHEEWNFHQPVLTVTTKSGVLHVSLNCADYQSIGGVVEADPVDLVNDCIDSLSLTLPPNVPVRVVGGTGSITTTGLRAGQRLRTDNGDIAVRRAAGSGLDAATGSGAVTATDVRADVVSLESDTGDVTASRVRAHSLNLHTGQGTISLTHATSTVSSVDDDAGDVKVSDVTSRADTRLHSGQGSVDVTRVTVGSIDARSDAGDVTLDTVRAGRANVASGQGTITVRHWAASALDITNDAGDVTVADGSARQMAAHTGQGALEVDKVRTTTAHLTSDAGDVTAVLTSKPTTVIASSGQGSVDLSVPTGRYDVDADSGQGTVTIRNLIIDTSVRPLLRAHSDSGDVTVSGT
jgi:DUF4097 and DUF4098 domain-containing protein YvlB